MRRWLDKKKKQTAKKFTDRLDEREDEVVVCTMGISDSGDIPHLRLPSDAEYTQLPELFSVMEASNLY